jgi:hypothetical protein
MAMFPDSVSFTLWRQASGSATEYALFSSVGGFVDGAQLSQVHLTMTGSGNQHTLTGSFASAQPTTNPVEFRLYGWNAATSLDSTHVVAASIRARFAPVSGTPIDPTGLLTVQGDLYHLNGGTLAIDVGGTTAGVSYDSIDVLGNVELEGDLVVSLLDVGGNPFVPGLNDSFDILTATQITGEFANVTLPSISWQYNWQLYYLSDTVRLAVVPTGDFNDDGFIDVADYIVWAKHGGTLEEYGVWRSQFGQTTGSVAGSSLLPVLNSNVPEPTGGTVLLLAATIIAASRHLQPNIPFWPFT